MKCAKCKTNVDDGSLLCSVCGNDLMEQKFQLIINGKKKFGIAKNLFYGLIAIFCLVSFYYMLFGFDDYITVVGNWKCANYADNIDIDDASIYYFSMTFNDDKSYSQVSFSDSTNSFSITGSYVEEKNGKFSANLKGYVDVYMVTESVIKNGKVDSSAYKTHYLIGISKDNNKAIVSDIQNDLSYVCRKY